MKIIRPSVIGDAQLTSSSIPETDYAAWSAGTTYAVGGRCIVSTAGLHRVYESLQAGNIGVYPPTDVSDPPKWLDIGPTNRWAMFDSLIGTASAADDVIDVTLSPGQIDSIAFFDVSAGEIEITMTSSGLEVYSHTIYLSSVDGITDWFSYYFEPIILSTDTVRFDLPAYASPVLRVRILQPGGVARCGAIVVGMQKALGLPQYGVKFGITDYSRKEKDTFGNWIVVERSYSKRVTADLVLDSKAVDDIHRTLSKYRATPLVWATTNRFTAGLVLGFYRDFSINVAYYQMSYCSLEIEGLT